jgi:hypothetical protein
MRSIAQKRFAKEKAYDFVEPSSPNNLRERLRDAEKQVYRLLDEEAGYEIFSSARLKERLSELEDSKDDRLTAQYIWIGMNNVDMTPAMVHHLYPIEYLAINDAAGRLKYNQTITAWEDEIYFHWEWKEHALDVIALECCGIALDKNMEFYSNFLEVQSPIEDRIRNMNVYQQEYLKRELTKPIQHRSDKLYTLHSSAEGYVDAIISRILPRIS